MKFLSSRASLTNFEQFSARNNQSQLSLSEERPPRESSCHDVQKRRSELQVLRHHVWRHFCKGPFASDVVSQDRDVRPRFSARGVGEGAPGQGVLPTTSKNQVRHLVDHVGTLLILQESQLHDDFSQHLSTDSTVATSKTEMLHLQLPAASF